MILPVHYQLFGPVAWAGSLQDSKPANNWVFPGSALSSAVKPFWFSRGYPKAAQATLFITWIPHSAQTAFRLVSIPISTPFGQHVEPTQIGDWVMANPETLDAPTPQGLYWTDAWNAMVDAGVDLQIGYQIGDDGVTVWQLFESRLSIDFIL